MKMNRNTRNNSLTLAVQQIKDMVSAVDVGQAMGLEIRHGRCQCPLHGGHDFNCRLYPGNKGFYCHVCKQGGDVIKLAQQYYGTSFKDTVAWFNDTFHLGMDIDSPLSPDAVKQAEIAQRKRDEEREFREWKDRMGFDLALTADRLVRILEWQRDRNTPKTPDEPWNPKFCEAVRLLPYARRFAEDCMFKCIEVKKNEIQQGKVD